MGHIFGVIYFRDFSQADAERLLSGGHLLVTGIAGTGKSLLIRSKLLPWLHARDQHFVLFDYHGDYAQDIRSHCWLGHDTGRAEVFERELEKCVKAAVSSSVVISQVPHADTLNHFLTSLFDEVGKGRGPKTPWFLIVDASHLTHSSSTLLDFVPVAETHGCTLVVTTQLMSEFTPYVFRHFKRLAQFCPSYGDDILDVYRQAKGVVPGEENPIRRVVRGLSARQFLCFSETEAPQGFALSRTDGYGTDHDPVLQ
jgi:hypothetical protein